MAIVSLLVGVTLAPAAPGQSRSENRSPRGGHVIGPAPAPDEIEVPAGGTTLPLLDFGGRPVVEVTINGRGPYRFILDTGAHISVVDASLNEELSLPAAAGVRAAPASGGDAPQVISIGELRVGDTILRGVMGAVMPLSRLLTGENAPRGVLSAACLPGYLVTFDFPGKRISITKGSLGDPDSQSTFDYPASDALPTVPIRVAGRTTRVHLDTGSGYGLTLPARFLDELPLASTPMVVGKARTPTGESPISKARVDGPITLGRFTLDLDEVSFSDVAPGPVPPTGQIGFEVLRRFAVAFDSKNRRIRFEQAAPTAATPAAGQCWYLSGNFAWVPCSFRAAKSKT